MPAPALLALLLAALPAGCGEAGRAPGQSPGQSPGVAETPEREQGERSEQAVGDPPEETGSAERERGANKKGEEAGEAENGPGGGTKGAPDEEAAPDEGEARGEPAPPAEARGGASSGEAGKKGEASAMDGEADGEADGALEEALAEIRRLQRRGRLAEARRAARRADRAFGDHPQAGRLKDVLAEIQAQRRKLPELRFAMRQLESPDARAVAVAGRTLLDAGEVGRMLLRQAVLEAAPPVAGEAAKLLGEAGDETAAELILERWAASEEARLAAAFSEALASLASELEASEASTVYTWWREAEGARARRLAGVLSAWFERGIEGGAARFDERLGAEGAFEALVASIKEAAAGSAPGDGVRAWAMEQFRQLDLVHLREDFDGYVSGATGEALRGWEMGEHVESVRVETERFAGEGPGAVLAMRSSGPHGDWTLEGIMHLFPGPLTGRFTVSFDYWEQSSPNHDGYLWLGDASGPVIGAGTTNPQWVVGIRDAGRVVHENVAGYEHWMRVVMEIDLPQQRARVTFEDTEGEARREYGWFELPEVESITHLSVGPCHQWYLDRVRVHPGPPGALE